MVHGWSRADGQEAVLRARLRIGADAPTDLGLGVWVSDAHGRWFQRALPGVWGPGEHEIVVALDAAAGLSGEGHLGAWNPVEAARSRRGGLFLWSARASNARIAVDWDVPGPATTVAARPSDRLVDYDDDGRTARTGVRYEVQLRRRPGLADPFADAEDTRLTITDPDGGRIVLRGFHRQPMALTDRGDREIAVADGAATTVIRWRPRRAGTHRLHLAWPGGSADLAPVTVSGEAYDPYLRVDAQDPRFFSIGGAFAWPMGPNLRSIWDLRSQERLGTRLTVDRGTRSYAAYLDRAAAGGADACEIWLSSWNLALEWNAGWDGFHGLAGVNEGNAERLDRILDHCERLGIRVNLVITNHGQGSERTDREWELSPWNRINGGPLDRASELFTDPRAREGRDRLHRYLVARYADSPAILGWKLWSEMNLTAGSREDLRDWHEWACARFADLDPYGHPTTSHWSGDYRTVDQALAAQPGLDFICIDAYHPPRSERGSALHELLPQGTANLHRGLSRLGKPVLITEYGGNWSACPEPQMRMEHRAGPWLGLVSGYAGAPMLWWFEWIDQGNRWGVYLPLRRFLAGEDLRGPQARHLVLATTVDGAANPPGVLALCWSRPGRRLGYLIDDDWGATGNPSPVHRGLRVDNGTNVPPGPITVEWWDADAGRVVAFWEWDHPGGPLVITAPPFANHLAFKLWRRGDQGGPDPAAPTE